MSVSEMGFIDVLSIMDSPAYDYNFDDIESDFLSRDTFCVQDVLSAFRFIERNATGAESLTIPLHILWCADSPQGVTFRKAINSASSQNPGAVLQFFELKSSEQLAELNRADIQMVLSAAQINLTWFAKHSTHQATIDRLKTIAN